MSDPYHSKSSIRAQQEEAAKARKIRLAIAGGVVLVGLLGGGGYLLFGGKSNSGSQQTPESVDAATLSSIDSLIEDGNAILNDATASAAAKAKWQKVDRPLLEKQRKEILDKHPEWKKK